MSNLVNRIKRINPRTNIRGTVSAEETGAETTTFYSIELSGYGDDYFNDGWWVQITSTTDDAAPVGVARKVSDYVSEDGKFVTAAFTANVNTGDEFEVIHERVYSQGVVDDAAIAISTATDGTQTSVAMDRGTLLRLGLANATATADNMSDITTTDVFAKLRLLLNRMSTDAFTATIQGSARTELDLMLANLATYISASGAAFSVQMNNQTARTNLEQVWEDLTTVLGVATTNTLTNINNAAAATFNAQNQAFAKLWGADGANQFLPTIQGSTRADLELALANLATYISAAGAAYSVNMANYGAKTNIEQTLEDFTTLFGVPTTTTLTNINNSANLTFDAVWQKFATLWGANGANVFNPTIAGSARTDLDVALNILATYLAPSAAAISVQMNNQTARTNFEEIWEDWTTLFGINGTNVLTNINNTANATVNAVFQKFAALWGADSANIFNPTIGGAARTDLETALAALGALSDKYGGLIYSGTCDADMGASATILDVLELAGFGDDYFNNKFYAYVVLNKNAVGVAPETQLRLITDYSSVDGVFTTAAFGANVEATDELYIIHESLANLIGTFDSSGVTNNFDGSLMEVLKSGLEQTTAGAYDPDTDSNEAISESLNGSTGVFHEQADVAVTLSVPNAATDVFDLTAADTRYIVRSLRLKAADPGANTLTVSLQELINDVETVVDTFVINAANFATYHSLMDMFGIPYIVGDNIRVYCSYSVAGPLAVTGQYQYAKTNV